MVAMMNACRLPFAGNLRDRLAGLHHGRELSCAKARRTRRLPKATKVPRAWSNPESASPFADRCRMRFDPDDPHTWPLYMTLKEVSEVLRHQGTRTVWALTTIHPDDGGLPFVATGTGRQRQRRLVHRDDLKVFIERRREDARPAPEYPSRKRRRKLDLRGQPGGFLELLTKIKK
jgi:hypothetical protein